MKRISSVVGALFIISLWFLCNTAFADIYKYVDSKGIIHLTNTPSDPNVTYVLVLKEVPPPSISISSDQKIPTDTQPGISEQTSSIDIAGKGIKKDEDDSSASANSIRGEMDDIDWGRLISWIGSGWGLVLLFLIISLGKWIWDIAKKGSKKKFQVGKQAWKGLPWNWKSFLVAVLIAIVINIVGSAFFEVKPRKNIIWTAWWIYLTIEAWKYLKWKALLPYTIYSVTVIIAGLIMANLDVEYMSWTHVIVAGTLNIGGLIIFSWLLVKSKKKIVEDAIGSLFPTTNATPTTTTFLASDKTTP